jgi:ATPase family protein associated with various cellular activities (AAA)
MVKANNQRRPNRALRASTLKPPLVQTKWPREGDSLNPGHIAAVNGWHSAGENGQWDIRTLFRDLRSNLTHSHFHGIPAKSCASKNWLTAVFELAPNLFITVGQPVPGYSYLRIWAQSPERAAAEFARLRKAYFQAPADMDADNAEFFVLTFRLGEPLARVVTISPKVRTAAELVLNYGKDFEQWHRQFIAQLQGQTSGLTILSGPPGTGKTSYLRFLIHQLKRTHRCYYLPTSVYPALASPACADFWIGETEHHKSKLVVIEDAESLLVERGSDNQEPLSNLLAAADGFLGDLLKLNIVCTVNSAISKLDPAIVRPGRLIATRQFRRLTPAEAEALAARNGLTLQPQESYSLAEIYHSFRFANDGATGKSHVGFAWH